jgi:hypothetical protein
MASASHDASNERDAGQGDLNDDFDPSTPVSFTPRAVTSRGAEKRGDNADDQGQPDRDVARPG